MGCYTTCDLRWLQFSIQRESESTSPGVYSISVPEGQSLVEVLILHPQIMAQNALPVSMNHPEENMQPG